MMKTGTTSEQYEIRVEGHVGTAVATRFPEFQLSHETDDTTTFSGVLPDQAALHGVLARIRDLGLTLICVSRVSVNRNATHEARKLE